MTSEFNIIKAYVCSRIKEEAKFRQDNEIPQDDINRKTRVNEIIYTNVDDVDFYLNVDIIQHSIRVSISNFDHGDEHDYIEKYLLNAPDICISHRGYNDSRDVLRHPEQISEFFFNDIVDRIAMLKKLAKCNQCDNYTYGDRVCISCQLENCNINYPDDSTNDDDDTCAVCQRSDYEDTRKREKVIITCCRKPFHRCCIVRALSNDERCPCCRSQDSTLEYDLNN